MSAHAHTHTYIHNFASFFSLPMALPFSVTCFLDDRHCLDKDRLSQCSFNLYFLYGEERGTLSPYIFIGPFCFFFWEPFVQLIFFLIVLKIWVFNIYLLLVLIDLKPGVVTHTVNQSTQRYRQGSEDFVVILGHIVSWRPSLATWNLVLKTLSSVICVTGIFFLSL